MKEYTLTLNADELQYVVNLIATQPYNKVSGLVAKIQSQVNEQDATE